MTSAILVCAHFGLRVIEARVPALSLNTLIFIALQNPTEPINSFNINTLHLSDCPGNPGSLHDLKNQLTIEFYNH
jgi:hypothetical protein